MLLPILTPMIMSRSLRPRGLKFILGMKNDRVRDVEVFATSWIEMINVGSLIDIAAVSRSLRPRGLKYGI